MALRVMVVEDDGIIAMDLFGILHRLGYALAGHTARGEDVLPVARQHHPDVVLMDIRLAGQKDGIQAATEVRRELGLPVIFLTAHSSGEFFQQALAADPDGYIVKPFDDTAIHHAVELAHNRHRARQASQAAGGVGMEPDDVPRTGLFGALLDRFTEIIGVAASEATFHFAALQEGRRQADGLGPRDLQVALGRIDAMIGQRSRIIAEGQTIRVGVEGSPMLAAANPVRSAVVRGLLEGVLSALRGHRYACKIVPTARPGEFVLECLEEGYGRAA